MLYLFWALLAVVIFYLRREDKREGYRLERWSNGQLMLTDLSEGVAIGLNAFGHTNAALFNAFLVSEGSNS